MMLMFLFSVVIKQKSDLENQFPSQEIYTIRGLNFFLIFFFSPFVSLI